MLIATATRMSDSGSEMGAGSVCEARSGAVVHSYRCWLTCSNAREQLMCNRAYLARVEAFSSSLPFGLNPSALLHAKYVPESARSTAIGQLKASLIPRLQDGCFAN
jgi:hypothetical protein